MRTMQWELSGTGIREQFTAASGEFMVAVKKMTDEAAVEWLNDTLPMLVVEAQRLCPVLSGDLRNSLTYFVIPEELCGYYGSYLSYTLWQEIGSQGRAGKHFLSGALASIKGVI